jgi:TRAP-type C4-dicarboxylate transport system permease small subunit
MGFLRLVDRLTNASGVLSAWMLFSIGLMVTYEVVMRKVFNAPTIWADEMARFFQIWAVYMAGAYVLKHRHLIAVDLFTSTLYRKTGRLLDYLSLLVIAAFSLVAVYKGVLIVVESIEVGRNTSTMLGVPKWMTESAIPVTFALLFLQTIAEAVLTATDENHPSISATHDTEETGQ